MHNFSVFGSREKQNNSYLLAVFKKNPTMLRNNNKLKSVELVVGTWKSLLILMRW